MITVGMNYQVLEGKESTFEKAFEGILRALQETDGHVSSHLYTDVHTPSSYLIISEWNDTVAFETFISSDKFRNVTAWGKEQILSGRPSHTVYGTVEPVS